MHLCDHQYGKASRVLRGKCPGDYRDPGFPEKQAAPKQGFGGLGFQRRLK